MLYLMCCINQGPTNLLARFAGASKNHHCVKWFWKGSCLIGQVDICMVVSIEAMLPLRYTWFLLSGEKKFRPLARRGKPKRKKFVQPCWRNPFLLMSCDGVRESQPSDTSPSCSDQTKLGDLTAVLLLSIVRMLVRTPSTVHGFPRVMMRGTCC